MTAMNAAVSNAINASVPSSNTRFLKQFLLFLVVCLAIGGFYAYKYYSAKTASVASGVPVQHMEQEQAAVAIIPPQPEPSPATVTKENWCFVGEDVMGRWCIRVPSANACDSNRLVPSEEDCKLVNASPMPLGVGVKADSLMNPLGPIPVMSNTY